MPNRVIVITYVVDARDDAAADALAEMIIDEARVDLEVFTESALESDSNPNYPDDTRSIVEVHGEFTAWITHANVVKP